MSVYLYLPIILLKSALKKYWCLVPPVGCIKGSASLCLGWIPTSLLCKCRFTGSENKFYVGPPFPLQCVAGWATCRSDSSNGSARWKDVAMITMKQFYKRRSLHFMNSNQTTTRHHAIYISSAKTMKCRWGLFDKPFM